MSCNSHNKQFCPSIIIFIIYLGAVENRIISVSHLMPHGESNVYYYRKYMTVWQLIRLPSVPLDTAHPPYFYSDPKLSLSEKKKSTIKVYTQTLDKKGRHLHTTQSLSITSPTHTRAQWMQSIPRKHQSPRQLIGVIIISGQLGAIWNRLSRH